MEEVVGEVDYHAEGVDGPERWRRARDDVWRVPTGKTVRARSMIDSPTSRIERLSSRWKSSCKGMLVLALFLGECHR